MRFEWDERKNELNLKQHKLRFQTAILVFEDPYAITLGDTAHDDVEERFITLGSVGADTIVLVVHTSFEMDGEETIRLISARKATAQERRVYETAHKRTTERYRRSRRNKRHRH